MIAPELQPFNLQVTAAMPSYPTTILSISNRILMSELPELEDAFQRYATKVYDDESCIWLKERL